MLNYLDEKQRRIHQFAKALQPMYRRTTQLVRDCCFLRIEERKQDPATTRALKAVKQRMGVKVVSVSELFEPNFAVGEEFEEGINEEWKKDNNSNRFVQFVFLERHFEMDLPWPMLWPNEAMHLLSRRTGYFYLRDRNSDASLADVVKRFDPLRKAYVHGDHNSAAEDIAYIFFDLWRFPIDSRLYLSAFGGNHTWEHDTVLE